MSSYTQLQNQQTKKLIQLSWDLIQNKARITHPNHEEITYIDSLKYIQQINSISPPIIPSQLTNLENVIIKHTNSTHWQQVDSTIRIKYYCNIIVACLEQNNQSIAKIYFDKLLIQLLSLRDMQKATYFLFKVPSLTKLRKYQLYQNKQYKYDKITQLLFYHILLILKPQQQLLINSTLTTLYQNVNDISSQKPFITALQKQNQNTPVNSFVRNIIHQIINKELEIIKHQQKSHFNKTEELLNQYEQIQKQQKDKNQKIVQIQSLLKRLKKQAFYPMIMKDLSTTNLFKKLLNNKKYKEIQIKNKQQQINQFYKKTKKHSEGNIIKFKNCKMGMYLLKYNHNNEQVDWRFVKIGQDGIYWGKNPQEIKFKYSWQNVITLVYGKVSKNISKKCKYICHDRIFSLILSNRSIDFVCQNEEEIINWLQGITYILNKTRQQSQQLQSKENTKVFFSKGKILWKSLFLKLSLQSKNMLAKSEGIKSQETIVRLHYQQLNRGKKS